MHAFSFKREKTENQSRRTPEEPFISPLESAAEREQLRSHLSVDDAGGDGRSSQGPLGPEHVSALIKWKCAG